MEGLIVVLIIVVVLAVILVGIYNGLIQRRLRIDEAFAQIDVQLKRRHDLIPNLVNAVNDYHTSIATFPNVLIAGPFGFTKREFFDAEPEAAEVPVVQLR